MPGTVSESTTLRPMMTSAEVIGSCMRRSSTISAPIRPKIAPDAPATSPVGLPNSITAADPPSSEAP